MHRHCASSYNLYCQNQVAQCYQNLLNLVRMCYYEAEHSATLLSAERKYIPCTGLGTTRHLWQTLGKMIQLGLYGRLAPKSSYRNCADCSKFRVSRLKLLTNFNDCMELVKGFFYTYTLCTYPLGVCVCVCVFCSLCLPWSW